MAYVTRERLNAARLRLLAAERDDVTVKRAAEESGFSHHGRFSILYREVFGESASETIRLPN